MIYMIYVITTYLEVLWIGLYLWRLHRKGGVARFMDSIANGTPYVLSKWQSKRVEKTPEGVGRFVVKQLNRARRFDVVDHLVVLTAPVVLVAFPLNFALTPHDASSTWWTVGHAASTVFWMKMAYDETKRNGPRWKKRYKRLKEAVTVNADGRLIITPTT